MRIVVALGGNALLRRGQAMTTENQRENVRVAHVDLTADGFEVVDLGINNPVENYLEAIENEQPDILGMSALLTTTMPYMKVVIDTLVEQGKREDYIVLVGGAPLNEEFGKAIGADAYCRDAAVAVETAKDFMAKKHNQMSA